MAPITPNRSICSPNTSIALERSITSKRQTKSVQQSIKWGSINAILFAVLYYDMSYTCPLRYNYLHYIERALIVITGMNILYYCVKFFFATVRREQVPITLEQKKLLGISDSDPNFKLVNCLNATFASPINSPSAKTPTQPLWHCSANTPNTSLTNTPMNMTAQSWRSATSNESLNYSVSSPSWTYQNMTGAPKLGQFSSSSPMQTSSIPYRDTSGIDYIDDEDDLNSYLKEFEVNTSTANLNNQAEQSTNLLSSFWSHPVTKTAKDMSTFLRKCTYQLSTQSPKSSSPKGTNPEDSSPTVINQTAMLVWSKLNVDMVTLTKWNENLRRWLSQTILERLVCEFESVNKSLEKQGLTDIKIGSVGLDRLRKTAQLPNIANFVPTLSTLIPFLELTSNQEYLEKRIGELAKGGCMSDFKWNGGGSYGGKNWDESLPTDSAIIMHLLAAYLDTQLMPLPNMPDVKPFSGVFYIKHKDKIPKLTPNSLFIQNVTEKPPHYRVIVGDIICEMVNGYSNLFHTILFFLYHVNKREHGMLGRVNLGRAGVNMLWIIEE